MSAAPRPATQSAGSGIGAWPLAGVVSDQQKARVQTQRLEGKAQLAWAKDEARVAAAGAREHRLVHHAEVMTLTGDSYRIRERRELLAKDRRAAQN
jgi:hypothetical protein